MTRAWAFKEIRETAPLAAVGVIVLLFLVALKTGGLGPLLDLHRGFGIPFLSDEFLTHLACVVLPLAIALGFRQTLGDLWGDAQLFLLHRPASRRHVFAVKLAIGATWQLVAGGLAIGLYWAWAALPGTHASPFFGGMTEAAWTLCLVAVVVYCGAFLSGLRPAAWLGTRLAPLAATTALALPAVWFPAGVAWPALIAGAAILVWLTLDVAAERDFS